MKHPYNTINYHWSWSDETFRMGKLGLWETIWIIESTNDRKNAKYGYKWSGWEEYLGMTF